MAHRPNLASGKPPGEAGGGLRAKRRRQLGQLHSQRLDGRAALRAGRLPQRGREGPGGGDLAVSVVVVRSIAWRGLLRNVETDGVLGFLAAAPRPLDTSASC